MKLMMWMALAKRLFTAINRTVSVIFRLVNPERCVSEGDVPRGVDPNPLISVYSSLILGLAIRGARRDFAQSPFTGRHLVKELVRPLGLSLANGLDGHEEHRCQEQSEECYA